MYLLKCILLDVLQYTVILYGKKKRFKFLRLLQKINTVTWSQGSP